MQQFLEYVHLFSLLQTASSVITPETEHFQLPSQLHAKRILYVKSIVRLLRLCGSKYQQLLTTPDGLKSFHSAISNLLTLINGVVTKGKWDWSLLWFTIRNNDFSS